jgi:hypothetical protein
LKKRCALVWSLSKTRTDLGRPGQEVFRFDCENIKSE